MSSKGGEKKAHARATMIKDLYTRLLLMKFIYHDNKALIALQRQHQRVDY